MPSESPIKQFAAQAPSCEGLEPRLEQLLTRLEEIKVRTESIGNRLESVPSDPQPMTANGIDIVGRVNACHGVATDILASLSRIEGVL